MERKRVRQLSLLFVIIMLGACARDIVPFTGNINGKVTDAENGEVLQGVTITITPSGASRTTGSDGCFEFIDMDPKQYEIQAKKSGYITNNKTVTVVAGRDVSGDISLTPIEQEGKLALSVDVLNFGSQNTSLSFDVLNNGNKSFNWNISGLDKVNWLSINPTTGSLAAGKSNAVTVTLDRDRISEYKEAVVVVNANSESVALKITAEAEIKESKITLSTESLDFGTESSSLTFDVKNVGNAGDVNWDITGIDVDWIKVSPTSGTTAMGKSSAVKVDLERDKLAVGKHTTTFLINANSESIAMKITAEVERKEPKITLSTETLDFGTESSSLTFDVKNTGNAGDVNWDITGIDVDWIKVSPTSGTTAMGKSSAVKVDLERDKLTAGQYTTTFLVNANSESIAMKITAEVERKEPIITLSTETLDFGTESSSLTFDVMNTGNIGDVNWDITGIDVDWIKVNPTSGTIAMGKSSAVKVDLERDKLTVGKHTTAILVNANGKSFRVTINAEKVEDRYLEVSPSTLVFGTDKSVTLEIVSHNGSTPYELYGEGDYGWVSFSKVEGVIPEYNPSDASTVEVITLYANRSGLAAGEYRFTLIIRSVLGDYRVPVTMTVEEGNDGGLVVPSGLYTYYRFDGNFEDSSENAVHGFGMNSPTFVEGITSDSKAVKFSRENNSSFVVSKPIIDSREMTISFWGKNFSDGMIFYMVSSIRSNPMFTLSMDGGQLKFIVRRYNNFYQYENMKAFMHPTLTDGQWHHITLTSDFNKTAFETITTTLYVDGQAVDVITEYANPYTEGGDDNNSYGSGVKFIMGGSVTLGYSDTVNGTNIVVDNFRVYDSRKLTAEEVKRIFDAKQ